MERKPEKALLAAVRDLTTNVEEDRAFPRPNADHSAALLDHVDGSRLAGCVRQQNGCIEAACVDSFAKDVLGT